MAPGLTAVMPKTSREGAFGVRMVRRVAGVLAWISRRHAGKITNNSKRDDKVCEIT